MRLRNLTASGLLSMIVLGWTAQSLSIPNSMKPLAPKTQCLDLDNMSPPPIRYGYPVWETVENPNCRPANRVNERTGECFDNMNNENACTAYCERSWGWYYGLPEPYGPHGTQNWCPRNDACSLSFSISFTPGETIVVTANEERGSTKSSSEVKAHKRSNTWSSSRGWDMNFGSTFSFDAKQAVRMAMELAAAAASGGTTLVAGQVVNVAGQVAAAAAGKPAGNAGGGFKDVGIGATFTAGFGYKMNSNRGKSESKEVTRQWSDNIQESARWGITRTRSSSVGLSNGQTFTKPSWASDFCGSWYAVPLTGLSCGRAAIGSIHKNDNGSTVCHYAKKSGLDVCVDYNFEFVGIPEASRSKMVFVSRDCEDGTILPGEFQDPAFGHSVSSMVEFQYDHLYRYSHKNLRSTKYKKDDAEWVQLRRGQGKNEFTKTIGPDEYNFEYCGRRGYCVRHMLSPGNCYDIPRNVVSETASVRMESARVTPGNCCVLFSRHQCHGQAQIIKGNITDFGSVGFHELGHSVVCNVAEYCDPEYREEPDYRGEYPTFIREPMPRIRS